ncbi:MAG: methionyl-tRNA formyltransferase [Aestuariivirga sp.]
MKTVFAGAVEGSRIALDALIGAGLAPALVVTLPPSAAGRHSDFSDLTSVAEAAGIEVHHTQTINGAATIAALRALEPDLAMVIGWSQICKQEFRSVAKLGCIGFHPAPLPRLRGRAVIPWTILLGETESASTLFWLDEGTDSGPILLQRRFELSPEESARGLYDKHTANLAAMLPEAVGLVARGAPPRVGQDHSKATYCAKRTPEDGLIDWREPAAAILRFIRAVGEPYPGAFAFHNEDKIVIDKARLFSGSHQYIGLTGQVQNHTAEGFTVRCGDGNMIEVQSWRTPRGGKPGVHSRLTGACR